MMMPLAHETWQMLRLLARNKNRPLFGRQLRITMSRRTKDGSFLRKLIDEGLIEKTTYNEDPFKALYRATPKGLQAAEYGEYDKEFKPLPTTEPLHTTPGRKRRKASLLPSRKGK